MKIKQVIVMRTDTDPPMRKGKMVAQGSHASIAFLTRRIEKIGNLIKINAYPKIPFIFIIICVTIMISMFILALTNSLTNLNVAEMTGLLMVSFILLAIYTLDEFESLRNNCILNNLTPEMQKWMFDGSFTKICLGVNSLQELQNIANNAKDAGLEVHIVTDSGKTEFKEPTITCLAIGPNEASKIDLVTGHLKLL